MKLFVFLIPLSIHLSNALLLPLNSTTLQIPYITWPALPYQRAITDELIIRITAYGAFLARKYTPNVLHALQDIQQVIKDAGEWDDVLEEITTVGKIIGNIYTEIGLYSLHPPSGLTRSEACVVLQSIWQLVIEFHPAKEIESSMILENGNELTLFRLNFRQN